MTKPHTLRTELPLLALLALLWGASYLFIKIAVAEIPPLTLIALRVSGAACFLMIVMYFRDLKLPRDSHTWRMLLVQAFLNSIGAWTVLAWGQQFVDAGLASVLNSTSPIFVFLFITFIPKHESTNGRKLAGATLGIVGVTLIVGIDALQGLGAQVAGQIACLIGAALYAGAAIYGKRFSHISSVATATGTMIWASVVLIPLAVIADSPWALRPSWQAITATLVLSILCTGVALLIYFRLVKTIGSLGVASQSYLRAGIGVMLGLVFLGESLSLPITLGLTAAITGVLLINWPAKTPTTKP
jgi:drug/metabolite transporter (DMT)-like permease